jgi:transposase-like protein
MAGPRRRFTPEQKVEILREHFKNKVAISELCRKYDINPNLFYRWEKETFEGWVSILSGITRKRNGKVLTTEHKLREKIQKLEEVIAWLTRENIDLKKSDGEV